MTSLTIASDLVDPTAYNRPATANPELRAAIRALGQAAFNIEYRTFREALDLEDDDYAVDKYNDLKQIGRAMSAFSDAALAVLVERYQLAIRERRS